MVCYNRDFFDIGNGACETYAKAEKEDEKKERQNYLYCVEDEAHLACSECGACTDYSEEDAEKEDEKNGDGTSGGGQVASLDLKKRAQGKYRRARNKVARESENVRRLDAKEIGKEPKDSKKAKEEHHHHTAEVSEEKLPGAILRQRKEGKKEGLQQLKEAGNLTGNGLNHKKIADAIKVSAAERRHRLNEIRGAEIRARTEAHFSIKGQRAVTLQP